MRLPLRAFFHLLRPGGHHPERRPQPVEAFHDQLLSAHHSHTTGRPWRIGLQPAEVEVSVDNAVVGRREFQILLGFWWQLEITLGENLSLCTDEPQAHYDPA